MSKQLWAGLDVGVETTSVCVIDNRGQIIHAGACPSSAKSVHHELFCLRRRRRSSRIGIEASSGMNLARGLRSLGYQVDLYEQRQLSKFLQLRRNKTDAGDAAGIAEAGRLGATTVSKVHLKTLECQCLQSRLTIRRHLVRQRVAAVNLLGRQLEVYGGRLSSTSAAHLRSNVEREIRNVFGKAPNSLVWDLRLLLDLCEQLIDHQRALDRELRYLAIHNDVCRRFMEIPGVGVQCALTFFAAIGETSRFRRCADVGPYLGLTPTLKQSGLKCRVGRISKMGNKAARSLLFIASGRFLRSPYADPDLQAWARGVEERSGRKKARVALARKLGTIMLAMWKSGECYQPRKALGLDRNDCPSETAELDFAAT